MNNPQPSSGNANGLGGFAPIGWIAMGIVIGMAVLFLFGTTLQGNMQARECERMRKGAYDVLRENEQDIAKEAKEYSLAPEGTIDVYPLTQRARMQRQLVKALDFYANPPAGRPPLIAARIADVSP